MLIKDMKMTLLVSLIIIVISCGQIILPAQARADSIGSFEIDEQVGRSHKYDRIEFTLGFGRNTYFGDPPTTGGVIFDELVLSTDDVGKTYQVSSGKGFDKAVEFLTNGKNDHIEYEVFVYLTEAGQASGGSEAHKFFGDATGANGIDFTGHHISSISLTVNSLEFDTPGSDPLGDGVWTDMVFNATVRVHSAPLPAGLWLFGSGLIGLIGVSRRKKAA